MVNLPQLRQWAGVLVLVMGLAGVLVYALNPMLSESYTGNFSDIIYQDTLVAFNITETDNVTKITVLFDSELTYVSGSKTESVSATFVNASNALNWTLDTPQQLADAQFTFNVVPDPNTETAAGNRFDVIVTNNLNETQNLDATDFAIDTNPPTVAIPGPIEAANFSSGDVTFTYEPSDQHLDDCVLLGNFSGTFTENQTDTAPTSGTQNTFSLTLPEGGYLWNVQCNDTLGHTASNDTNKTFTVDTTPPTTAPLLTSVDDSNDDGNIEIAWNADANAQSYNLYRHSSNFTDAASATLLADNLTGLSYEDNTTEHGTTYFYALTSADQFGRDNTSIINTTSGASLDSVANDTIGPPVVQDLDIDRSGATATLTWDPIIVDVDGNSDFFEISYEIWRGTDVDTSKTFVNHADSGFEKIDTVPTNSDTDTVDDSDTYHYVVVPRDDADHVNYTIDTSSGGNYESVSLTVEDDSDGGGGGGSGGSGTSNPGATYSRSWDVLSQGTTKVTINKNEIAIEELSISANEQTADVDLTVKKLNAKPSSISSEVDGTIYQYLEITTENLATSAIDRVIVTFDVPKSWLNDNDIKEDDVALYRYTSSWNKLPSSKINDAGSTITYTAISPGFSVFAIGGIVSEPEIKTAEVVEETTDAATEQLAGAEEALAQQTQGTNNSSKLWILWVFIVLVVIGAMILYFVYLKPKLLEQE